MRGGGINWLALVILVSILVYPSSARMGYDIIASVGSHSFALDRTTTNLYFSLDGSVSGIGNFSRLTHIDKFAGVKADEQTSCTKKSDLNYSEMLRLLSWEGPVVVTVNLQSNNITNQSQSTFAVKESADINVDEKWPTLFANIKDISYFGPGIRTSERYENNGDVAASYIDSWKLSKTSFYQAKYNRTIIDANISSSGVFQDISSNKSSSYRLGMQSTGSLTHLDVTQRGSANQLINKISEDYRGQQNINLKVGMNSSIIRQPEDNNIEWLPCCSTCLNDEEFVKNQIALSNYILTDDPEADTLNLTRLHYPCFFQC